MAELIGSIKAIALPKLGLLPPMSGGIKQWLVKEPYSASLDDTGTTANLEIASLEKLVQYISFDYERFALSSWESFYSSSLESDRFNLVSWPLLKIYYAAFFAAHAIMRATGGGVMRVERDQATTISQIISLQSGATFELKPGTYQYCLGEGSSGTPSLTLSPVNSKVGVHDGFWKTFKEYLNNKSSIAVKNNSVESSDFVAAVSQLSPSLSGWLSARRNDINYQHEFGVWFPVANARKLNDSIRSSKRCPSSSVDIGISKDNAINLFISVSRYLSCLNAELADYVAARSTQKRAFGAQWRKFANLHVV